MTDPNLSDPPTKRGWRSVALVLVLALAVAGSFGVFVTQSFSHGLAWQVHYIMGGSDMLGPPSPDQIEDRADRIVRHLAIEIDATADQQSKLQAIVKGAIKDLLPMREQALAARQKARDLLTQ